MFHGTAFTSIWWLEKTCIVKFSHHRHSSIYVSLIDWKHLKHVTHNPHHYHLPMFSLWFNVLPRFHSYIYFVFSFSPYSYLVAFQFFLVFVTTVHAYVRVFVICKFGKPTVLYMYMWSECTFGWEWLALGLENAGEPKQTQKYCRSAYFLFICTHRLLLFESRNWVTNMWLFDWLR